VFKPRVADFYRARGYEVREGVKVRGASQMVYTLDMVAEGPLGALLVSFGDAAGVDAAEIARVRTLARDIGATPVIATPSASAEVRRLAAQLTVVLLEEESLDDPAPRPLGPALSDPVGKDLAAHPWPESGRTGPAASKPDGLLEVEQVVKAEPQPAAWQPAEAPAAAPRATPTGRFAWLDSNDAAPTGPRAPLPPAKPIEHEGTVEARMPTKRVSMGRLALYVAGFMLALYILVKLVS
jgi:hypothetical protein